MSRSTDPRPQPSPSPDLYKSRPPHKRAGKFSLSADRIRTCCVEAAAANNATGDDPDMLCQQRLPTKLWIAFKCRSVAVSQITVLASHK